MSYRPFPDIDRARHQMERGRLRPKPRVWKAGGVVTLQDFGITPGAPNAVGDALRRNLSQWAEAFRAAAPERPVTDKEQTT